MSLSMAVLDALVKSGATQEMLVAAMRADIAEREAREARQIPWERLRQLAFDRDGDKCGWCGCVDGPFEVDHIIPRAKGGENTLENVIVSCRSCNRAKRDREEAEWSGLHARRVKDRERKRRQRNRDKSRDNWDNADASADPAPNERDNLTPTRVEKPSPKGESKNPVVEAEKRQAIASCLRVAFPPPNGVSDEVWADFLRSPKRRKAGMSKTAYSGICNNLVLLAEHGFPPGEMIALAVERGWTTVKLEWVQNEQRTNSLGRNQPADGLSSTARAAIAVFGAPSAGHQR
jgi:hypothetical protein